MNNNLYSKLFLGIVLGLLLLNFVIAAEADSGIGISSTETVLSKNLPISGVWGKILNGLFRLPSETALTLQYAILLTVLFFVTFFVISNVVALTPFFRGRVTLIVVSIIITILISLSGGIYDGVVLLLALFDFSSGGLGLALAILVLIVIAIIVNMVSYGLSRSLRKEEASIAGFNMGKKVAESSLYARLFGR